MIDGTAVVVAVTGEVNVTAVVWVVAAVACDDIVTVAVGGYVDGSVAVGAVAVEVVFAYDGTVSMTVKTGETATDQVGDNGMGLVAAGVDDVCDHMDYVTWHHGWRSSVEVVVDAAVVVAAAAAVANDLYAW